jgi:hypothetical protein
MNRIQQARLHPPLNTDLGRAGRRPAGVHYRGAGQAADDRSGKRTPPAGTSLMNDTADASVHPTKGGRPWRS